MSVTIITAPFQGVTDENMLNSFYSKYLMNDDIENLKYTVNEIVDLGLNDYTYFLSDAVGSTTVYYNVKYIEWLVLMGANVNKIYEDGDSILMKAIRKNIPVELFIQARADVLYENPKGENVFSLYDKDKVLFRSELFFCVICDKIGIVKAYSLLEKSTSENAKKILAHHKEEYEKARQEEYEKARQEDKKFEELYKQAEEENKKLKDEIEKLKSSYDLML